MLIQEFSRFFGSQFPVSSSFSGADLPSVLKEKFQALRETEKKYGYLALSTSS